MEYRFDKEQYFKEAKDVYSKYPSDVSDMERLLDEQNVRHPEASPFQKKPGFTGLPQNMRRSFCFLPVRSMQK